MKTLVLLAGLMLSTAQPLLADNAVISVKPSLMIFRDSDGIVISVLHPIDYYTPMTGVGTIGGVVYTMGGVELEFSGGPGVTIRGDTAGGGVMTAGVGTTAVVGGTSYKVEVSGNDIWLRDPVTGARYATEQRMASGLQVNPNGFAME